jgi:hypothetical protein
MMMMMMMSLLLMTYGRPPFMEVQINNLNAGTYFAFPFWIVVPVKMNGTPRS